MKTLPWVLLIIIIAFGIAFLINYVEFHWIGWITPAKYHFRNISFLVLGSVLIIGATIIFAPPFSNKKNKK